MQKLLELELKFVKTLKRNSALLDLESLKENKRLVQATYMGNGLKLRIPMACKEKIPARLYLCMEESELVDLEEKLRESREFIQKMRREREVKADGEAEAGGSD